MRKTRASVFIRGFFLGMAGLPEQIRAFVAVRIPAQCLAALTRTQQDLKSQFTEVSWTRPEAMHLTLQFLGNIPSAEIVAMARALQDVTCCFAPFHLELRGLGSFGSRVVWAGVEGETETLAKLAGAVRAALAQFGSHEEERAYSAHITMGRLRRPGQGANTKLRALADRAFGSWRVDEIELIRSELSPHGARYTVLNAAKLGVRSP